MSYIFDLVIHALFTGSTVLQVNPRVCQCIVLDADDTVHGRRGVCACACALRW